MQYADYCLYIRHALYESGAASSGRWHPAAGVWKHDLQRSSITRISNPGLVDASRRMLVCRDLPTGSNTINIRIHVVGLSPAYIRDQLDLHGELVEHLKQLISG